MEEIISLIKEELALKAQPEKITILQRFFKTGPGEYAEGDDFLGIVVPDQRLIAKKFASKLKPEEMLSLLKSQYHEHRLTALLIWTYQYPKASENEKEKIAKLYLQSTNYINNWDLVDLSAYKILGTYLESKPRQLLYDLADSNNLWEQRIAIITTLHFIRKNDFTDTLKLSEILLNHQHDLIQKAVGWMLREVGKRNLETEINFLNQHYQNMPRTMLRYAIEKFDEKLRQSFLIAVR